MKLFITPQPQQLAGYTNICPMLGHDIRRMDQYEIFDAQCEEILAPEILDFVDIKELVPTVQHWVAKIRHGGKLILGGTDAHEVARTYVLGITSTDAFNKLLFGNQDFAWTAKRTIISISEVKELILDLGLNITKARLDKFSYLVEANRT